MYCYEWYSKYLQTRKKFNRSKPIGFIIKTIVLITLSFVFSYTLVDIANLVVGENTPGSFSLLILLYLIAIFFHSLSEQTKRIYEFKDKHLMAYLPISKRKIYFGKLLYSLSNTYKFSLVLSTPLFIIKMLFIDLSFSCCLCTILSLIIFPIIPFILSSLIITPMILIKHLMRNNFSLNLLLSIGSIAVLFYFYNQAIFNIARVALFEDLGKGNILQDFSTALNNNYVPSTWIASSMLNHNITPLLLILIFGTILSVLLIFLNSFLFTYVFNKLMGEKSNSKVIKTNNTPKKSFIAYFLYELKSLYRDSSYSFSYIGMSLLMPFMLYCCNKFLVEFAVDRLGENITFGTTLLVILMFIAMICSTTATFISREGDSFWILKTNPHGITKPLIAKSLVGVLFSGTATIISVLLSIISKQLTVEQGIFILFISLLFIIGLVALGMNINLLKPNLFYSNIENNSNLLSHLFIGFTTSTIIGLFSILSTFYIELKIVSLICLFTSFVFALINILALLLFGKKLYKKMEV